MDLKIISISAIFVISLFTIIGIAFAQNFELVTGFIDANNDGVCDNAGDCPMHNANGRCSGSGGCARHSTGFAGRCHR